MPTPNSVARIARSRLLGARDKVRFFAYMARLLATQAGDLRVDLDHDAERAVDELAAMGERARDRIVRRTSRDRSSPASRRCRRPSSARGCVACRRGPSSTSTAGWTPRGATSPDARRAHGVGVEKVAPPATACRDRRHGGGIERFDGAVVAVPAPVAAAMVGAEHRPGWLDEVALRPHVRLYAARPRPARRPQRHPRVPERPRRHRRDRRRRLRRVGPGARRLGVGARLRPGRVERPAARRARRRGDGAAVGGGEGDRRAACSASTTPRSSS